MDSVFRMIDVGDKPITRRVAEARGEIKLSAATVAAIREKRVPKGDVLTLAEVAGITAAKRTSDILPLCHPLPLDAVRLECRLDESQKVVVARAEVVTHGRTGVEMEALSAVSAALLCVYDLTKSIDRGAIISGIQLEHKSGGKSGTWKRGAESLSLSAVSSSPLAGVAAGVLTISDRCAAGTSTDVSGELLREFLAEQGAEVAVRAIVPDEIARIRDSIKACCYEKKLGVLLVTGGTGIGPRDVTPEALQPLWTKELPGFGEMFRTRGLLNTPRAWISRASAGVVENTLVAILPGSPGGVRDGVLVLKELLPHLLGMIRGEGH